jgi:hypothetical protein
MLFCNERLDERIIGIYCSLISLAIGMQTFKKQLLLFTTRICNDRYVDILRGQDLVSGDGCV